MCDQVLHVYKPWEEVSAEYQDERNFSMSNRVSPKFPEWCLGEVSLRNQVKQRNLFASFQDVEYRVVRGVSHQVQEPLCARDRQAV